MKRRIPKPKPLHPKRRKKKEKAPDLVSHCDHCGKAFGKTKAGMTYARTENSAGIMGVSNGLYVEKRNGVILVFCCVECMKGTLS